ncbi:hypothetical protein JS756_03035 [Streptomyces actuosus]|uniref:SpdB protein n=1 Tax=Streptomyces actuosus TaxID=1885 RepID=A0ABS2VJ30_STRAS|nr:hypothetical protein [Streptomyces actuosus]MBN0043104.1 hypothetical protein [Streptomyces actuosus]
MSDLEKAARDAVDAADNAEMVRQIAALLAAQQLANAQQQPAAPAPAPAHRPVGLYVAAGIGGAVALSFLAMAAALLAAAIAVGAVATTVCVLVLRSVWQDMQRGR